MSLFLLPEDVRRLTGLERPSAQLRWCKENGVQAWLSADNEVIVPVSAIHGKPAANESAWNMDISKIG